MHMYFIHIYLIFNNYQLIAINIYCEPSIYDHNALVH